MLEEDIEVCGSHLWRGLIIGKTINPFYAPNLRDVLAKRLTCAVLVFILLHHVIKGWKVQEYTYVYKLMGGPAQSSIALLNDEYDIVNTHHWNC